MPTTTALSAGQSASTSAPTSSSSQSDSDTATLYLFTFLATILILVLLSASLVLRSYILRRRYRRRFQRALSDALFVNVGASNGVGPFDPSGFPRSSRRVGPKPVLWDIWTYPANKATWSSLTPVAVRCIPSSLPSTLMPLPQPSTTPHATVSSSAGPSALLAQLRRTSSSSLVSPPSSSRQARPPILSRGRSRPPSVATPTRPSIHAEKDTTTLAVYVLVAMPDASAPVHRPVPDAKGKGVVQAPRQSGDVDPLSSSPLHRAGTRIPNFASDEEGPPLLEFGVAEIKMRDWGWSLAGT